MFKRHLAVCVCDLENQGLINSVLDGYFYPLPAGSCVEALSKNLVVFGGEALEKKLGSDAMMRLEL